MRFKVRAQWRRPDGTVVGVAAEVTAGDACKALQSAWPPLSDRPCSAVALTIEPVGQAAIADTTVQTVRTAAAEVARPADAHAAALLDRLQAEAAQLETGSRSHVAMAYPDVLRTYNDMIESLGWRPAPWACVSRALRRLTNGRRRYINAAGGKLLMFDIPVATSSPAAHPIAIRGPDAGFTATALQDGAAPQACREGQSKRPTTRRSNDENG